MLNLEEIIQAVYLSLEAEDLELPKVFLELPDADKAEVLNRLNLMEVTEIMCRLTQATLVELFSLPHLRRRSLILEQLDTDIAVTVLKKLPADVRIDIISNLSPYVQFRLLPKMPENVQNEIRSLSQYEPNTSGGIMTTEFVGLYPEMTVHEALDEIRSYASEKESIYACYILEKENRRLLGTVSLRDLIIAEGNKKLKEIMRRKPISVNVNTPKEIAAHKISKYNLLAIPVLENDNRVVGFVTVDDVIDVMVEEETERSLRMAAVDPDVLDTSYISIPFFKMVKQRALWLTVLFLGEMLTATAMGAYEDEIAKAVILAIFLPLIISSGGNSGSQATTLIIRAMTLGEFKLSDWWKIARREMSTGLALGGILGTIGFLRIALWGPFTDAYGSHYLLIGLAVAFSLVGVVAWGTLCGAMLPFILRRLGLDPATSSAPFVATLVDVTGLMIYFNMAMLVLRGTLL